jgi:hypothetical protein
LQSSRKRSNTYILASPSKRIAGAILENNETTNPTLSILPGFTPGTSEKAPARSLFKAARKCKNKVSQAVKELDLSSVKKEGFLKPSKIQ